MLKNNVMARSQEKSFDITSNLTINTVELIFLTPHSRSMYIMS